MIRKLQISIIPKLPLSSSTRSFLRPLSSSHSSKDQSESTASTAANEVEKGGMVSSEVANSYSTKDSSESKGLTTVNEDDKGIISREEAYKQVYDLDFMKATQILLTTPPKRKKFGFDFHLVQFFFCCLPSLAVYLVAQYARYEMRKMEAEHEAKRKEKEEAEEKAREEEKAKEAEMHALENDSPVADISTVIGRLDALEEVVKEIVGEKKKSDTEVKPNATEVVASNKQIKATNGTTPVCSDDTKSSNRVAKDR